MVTKNGKEAGGLLNIVMSPISFLEVTIYFISSYLCITTPPVSLSPLSCFNEYQKFANDFAVNSCLLSSGLLKQNVMM